MNLDSVIKFRGSNVPKNFTQPHYVRHSLPFPLLLMCHFIAFCFRLCVNAGVSEWVSLCALAYLSVLCCVRLCEVFIYVCMWLNAFLVYLCVYGTYSCMYVCGNAFLAYLCVYGTYSCMYVVECISCLFMRAYVTYVCNICAAYACVLLCALVIGPRI